MLKRALLPSDIKVEGLVVEGNPPEEILRRLEGGEFDLVVLGSPVVAPRVRCFSVASASASSMGARCRSWSTGIQCPSGRRCPRSKA